MPTPPPQSDPPPVPAGSDSTALYLELRELARRQLRRERAGTSWSPTDLANEAWLRVQSRASACDRQAFLRVCVVVMQHLLTDRARRLIRLRQRFPQLAEHSGLRADRLGEGGLGLVELADALGRLERLDPRKARVAWLLGLIGCSQEEAAAALGVSLATLKRDWAFSAAWLRRQLQTHHQHP